MVSSQKEHGRRALVAICGFIQPIKLRHRINGEDDDGRYTHFMQIGLPKGVVHYRRYSMNTASEIV